MARIVWPNGDGDSGRVVHSQDHLTVCERLVEISECSAYRRLSFDVALRRHEQIDEP